MQKLPFNESSIINRSSHFYLLSAIANWLRRVTDLIFTLLPYLMHNWTTFITLKIAIWQPLSENIRIWINAPFQSPHHSKMQICIFKQGLLQLAKKPLIKYSTLFDPNCKLSYRDTADLLFKWFIMEFRVSVGFITNKERYTSRPLLLPFPLIKSLPISVSPIFLNNFS